MGNRAWSLRAYGGLAAREAPGSRRRASRLMRSCFSLSSGGEGCTNFLLRKLFFAKRWIGSGGSEKWGRTPHVHAYGLLRSGSVWPVTELEPTTKGSLRNWSKAGSPRGKALNRALGSHLPNFELNNRTCAHRRGPGLSQSSTSCHSFTSGGRNMLNFSFFPTPRIAFPRSQSSTKNSAHSPPRRIRHQYAGTTPA